MENSNRLSLGKLLIIVTLIAVLGGAGWYGWQHFKTKNSDSSAKSSLGDQWAEYKNNQYGFEFSYLKSWGEPKLIAVSSIPKQSPTQGAPRIVKQTGTRYEISFPDIQQKTPLIIVMETNDYSAKSCTADNQCTTSTASTKDDIKAFLAAKQIKVKPFKMDDSSFTNLAYAPRLGELTITQIINLSKTNVSIASINYSLLNAGTNCNKTQLSPAGTSHCITESDYSNLNSLAKSFKSV